jgi:hypothetical protein
LDDQLVAAPHSLLDGHVLARAAGVVLVLDILVVIVVQSVFLDDVGCVQEGCFLEAEVDEGRLHAREHAKDLALIDVAGRGLVAAPFYVDLGQSAVLQKGDSHLVASGVDDDLFAQNVPRNGTQRSSGRLGATPAGCVTVPVRDREGHRLNSVEHRTLAQRFSVSIGPEAQRSTLTAGPVLLASWDHVVARDG